MKNDVLRELLANADQVSSPPAPDGELAQRVRQQARRKARNRGAAAALGTTAACALVAVLLLYPKSIPPVSTPVPDQLAALKSELAALDAQALLHQRTAEALSHAVTRGKQLRAQANLAARLDALDRVDQARDRAALLLLREADRAAARPQDRAAARESYQRAASLFPETPAGRVAAGKLGPLGILL